MKKGDVIHLHFLGRSVIVLNSVEAAVDLLEKRSNNYSDRPRFVMFELRVSRSDFMNLLSDQLPTRNQDGLGEDFDIHELWENISEAPAHVTAPSQYEAICYISSFTNERGTLFTTESYVNK